MLYLDGCFVMCIVLEMFQVWVTFTGVLYCIALQCPEMDDWLPLTSLHYPIDGHTNESGQGPKVRPTLLFVAVINTMTKSNLGWEIGLLELIICSPLLMEVRQELKARLEVGTTGKAVGCLCSQACVQLSFWYNLGPPPLLSTVAWDPPTSVTNTELSPSVMPTGHSDRSASSS